MDKSKIIEEKIVKAFKKLSERFEVEPEKVRIAIICTGDSVKYAAYNETNTLGEIALKDVVDLGFMSMMVSEKDVQEGILNKFYLFSIPINAPMSELRVFIVPTQNSSNGYLYRKNELLNSRGFKVSSLF